MGPTELKTRMFETTGERARNQRKVNASSNNKAMSGNRITKGASASQANLVPGRHQNKTMSNISILDRISERANRMEEKYFSSKLKAQLHRNEVGANSVGGGFQRHRSEIDPATGRSLGSDKAHTHMKQKRPTVYSQSKFDSIKEATRRNKRAASNVADKFSVSGQASRVFGKKVSSPNPPPQPGRVSTRRDRDDSHHSQNLSTTTKSRFNTIDQYNGAVLGRTDSRHASPFKPAADTT